VGKETHLEINLPIGDRKREDSRTKYQRNGQRERERERERKFCAKER